MHLPESQAKDAAAVLAAIAVADKDLTAHNPATPQIRRGRRGITSKDPGEHHAIVPLRKVPGPGDAAPEALRLWLLVAKNFLAAHMADGIDARTTVTAEVATPLGPEALRHHRQRGEGAGLARPLRHRGRRGRGLVPGKAKADDEPTTARLPPVRDGEAGRGGEP